MTNPSISLNRWLALGLLAVLLLAAAASLDADDRDLVREAGREPYLYVIFDVSGLETLDSSEFADLRRIITMCKIMGAESVLVGLRPGVVSALVEAGAEVDGLRAAIDLDAAFALLQPDPEPDLDGEDEAEADTATDPGDDPQSGFEPRPGSER